LTAWLLHKAYLSQTDGSIWSFYKLSLTHLRISAFMGFHIVSSEGVCGRFAIVWPIFFYFLRIVFCGSCLCPTPVFIFRILFPVRNVKHAWIGETNANCYLLHCYRHGWKGLEYLVYLYVFEFKVFTWNSYMKVLFSSHWQGQTMQFWL
jgi:hypothetical protein